MNKEKAKNILMEFRRYNKYYKEGKSLTITITFEAKEVLNEAIRVLLIAYEEEKEKNKNKDKILRNIRDEFLKYNWKDANSIQTYNQIKSLYESIYCKPYED